MLRMKLSLATLLLIVASMLCAEDLPEFDRSSVVLRYSGNVSLNHDDARRIFAQQAVQPDRARKRALRVNGSVGLQNTLATLEMTLSDDEESMEGERVVSVVAAAIGFVVCSALAVFAIAIADDVALWIWAIFVLAACFFGWLLFFAPASVRVAVARWFPWC